MKIAIVSVVNRTGVGSFTQHFIRDMLVSLKKRTGLEAVTELFFVPVREDLNPELTLSPEVSAEMYPFFMKTRPDHFDLAIHIGLLPSMGISHERVKAEVHISIPFFETTNPPDVKHLALFDFVFFNSQDSCRVIEDVIHSDRAIGNLVSGKRRWLITQQLSFAPLVSKLVEPAPRNYLDEDRGNAPIPIKIINVGKWELRKGHYLLPAIGKRISVNGTFRPHFTLFAHNHWDPKTPHDFLSSRAQSYDRKPDRTSYIFPWGVIDLRDPLAYESQIEEEVKKNDWALYLSHGEGYGMGSNSAIALNVPTIVWEGFQANGIRYAVKEKLYHYSAHMHTTQHPDGRISNAGYAHDSWSHDLLRYNSMAFDGKFFPLNPDRLWYSIDPVDASEHISSIVHNGNLSFRTALMACQNQATEASTMDHYLETILSKYATSIAEKKAKAIKSSSDSLGEALRKRGTAAAFFAQQQRQFAAPTPTWADTFEGITNTGEAPPPRPLTETEIREAQQALLATPQERIGNNVFNNEAPAQRTTWVQRNEFVVEGLGENQILVQDRNPAPAPLPAAPPREGVTADELDRMARDLDLRLRGLENIEFRIDVPTQAPMRTTEVVPTPVPAPRTEDVVETADRIVATTIGQLQWRVNDLHVEIPPTQIFPVREGADLTAATIATPQNQND